MNSGELTRESARDAAREELSRRDYDVAQPPLLVRVLGRVLRWIGDALDTAAEAVPGGAFGLVLVLVLLVALVAVVLARVRPGSDGREARTPLFAGATTLTADEHRARAEQAAAAGAWADAVRERLRAVVRDLEARGVLDPRPGRTAGEVAHDAGAAVPAVADDLRRGAVLFDEIWYGGRPADASSYALLVEVDRRVGSSRAVLA